jgi:carboxyl-terminal processing protease
MKQLIAAALAAIVWVCTPLPGCAQNLVNPGFELRAGSLPAGWFVRGEDGYVLTIDSVGARQGRYAARLSRAEVISADSFGAVTQNLNPEPWRGKWVRYRAWVRALVPDSSSGHLLLRTVLPDSSVATAEMMFDQPIRTREWKRFEIKALVEEDAARIDVGFGLAGGGSIWVDSVTLELIPEGELAAPSPRVLRFVEEVYGHMRRESIRRDSVNWGRVHDRMVALARGTRTTADYYPALHQVLRMLGDHHSSHLTPQKLKDTRVAGGTTENPPVVVKRIASNVGYIEIGNYWGFDQDKANAYAADAHAKLKAVDSPEICRWVVDLRRNNGGNFWPMLAALGPILGNGFAGRFITASDSREWGYEKGAIWFGDEWHRGVNAGSSSYALFNEYPLVAVLTSGETASAGEAAAVAFRGRPDARSFGRPTYGVSTSNSTIELSDSSMLVLTSARYGDRLGRLYGSRLQPDTPVNADRNDDPAQDPTVQSAMHWLSKNRCQVVRRW